MRGAAFTAGAAGGSTPLVRRLAAAGRGSVAMTLSVMLVSLASQLVIARRFGLGGLGEYNAASLFISIVTTLGYFGLPVAITQRVAEREQAAEGNTRVTIDAALTISVAVAAGGALVAMLLWPPFTSLTNVAGATSAGLVGLACAAMVVQYAVTSVLLGQLELRWVTLIAASQPAAVIAVGMLLGPETNGSSLTVLGCLVTGCASLAYVVFRGYRPSFRRAEIGTLLKSSVPSMTFLYVTLLTSWLDRLVATLVLGPVGLGTFVAASYFIEAVLRLPRASGSFAVAAYARLVDDARASQRLLDSQLRIQAAYSIVAGAVLIGAAPSLLELLFGPSFRVATTPLQLLAIALLPMGVSWALAHSATGSREVFLRPSFMVLMVALQIVANLVGATSLAVAGLGLAILGVWLIATVSYARQAAQRVHSTAAYATLALIAGAAAPCYAVALVVGRGGLPLALPVQIALSGGVALGICGLALLRQPERQLLLRMLRPGAGA